MKKRRKDELRVTDHAIVRYLDRVHGLDKEKLARRIINDEIRLMHKQLGDGKFPHRGKEKFRVVVVNNAVVTILESKG